MPVNTISLLTSYIFSYSICLYGSNAGEYGIYIHSYYRDMCFYGSIAGNCGFYLCIGMVYVCIHITELGLFGINDGEYDIYACILLSYVFLR
jgi:hypothetical protein